MNSPGGYIYVLHGEDAFGRDEAVQSLKRRIRELPAGEHNLTELGPETTVANLRLAADVVPFLADRRMVIVRGMLARLAGRGSSTRRPGRGRKAVAASKNDRAETAADELTSLLEYLPEVPQTTSLAFVEDGRLTTTDLLAQAIPRGRSAIREYPRVLDRNVPNWIRERARQVEVDLQEDAVHELAQLGGTDLRRLASELQKLRDYAAGRSVNRADVREIVVGRDMAVWALLDGLSERRQDKALQALRTLYAQGEPPEALLGRDIAPHYRRLMVARELSLLSREERTTTDVAALGVNPATIGKWSEQAAAFDPEELERALLLLLNLDRQIKIGETEAEASLEMTIVQLCSRLGSPV